MNDLDAYYRNVGYLRATGLDEGQAYHQAEVTMEAAMNEWNIQNILTDALASYAEEAGTVINTRTYEDAGILTRDKGLVVEVEGSRFQLTIVKT